MLRMGFSRPLSPGKWMATSPLRLLWCSNRHDLQDVTPYLGKTRDAPRLRTCSGSMGRMMSSTIALRFVRFIRRKWGYGHDCYFDSTH
jgi:hypothetical protein